MSQPHDPSTDSAEDTPSEREIIRRLVDSVLEGSTDLDQFGRWLVAAAERGESPDEIAGVVDALRGRMVPVTTDADVVTDTCGTGGDGTGTFNISTAAAFVVAAAGIPVAKHGNRAVSSRTGSADVLESLGVRIDLPAAAASECLRMLGICFCFAPNHHPAMAKVGALRKSLGRPTVFNLVGPLCNPAGARVQVIGVGRRSAREGIAKAAVLVGLSRALVVSGAIGGDGVGEPAGWLDEVSLFGPTDVIEVREDRLREFRWSPEHFGLATLPPERFAELSAAGPEESAAAIREVLAGENGPKRDVVVLNAAALLWAAASGGSVQYAREMAEEAIDSGRAERLLAALVRATND